MVISAVPNLINFWSKKRMGSRGALGTRLGRSESVLGPDRFLDHNLTGFGTAEIIPLCLEGFESGLRTLHASKTMLCRALSISSTKNMSGVTVDIKNGSLDAKPDHGANCLFFAEYYLSESITKLGSEYQLRYGGQF